LPRGHAGRKRQDRLRAIQSLYLAFFVHTQYNGAVWWIHVKPHNVPYLLDELGILGEFEVLYPVRLQS